MARQCLSAVLGFLATVAVEGLPAAPRSGDVRLQDEIQSLLRRAGLGPRDASITVLAEDGRLVVNIHSRMPMKPASNMKILTTLAALELLGPDHAYVTRLTATAPIEKGVIAGDVVIHGTGDPNISGRFYGNDPLALFRDWASRLRRAGLVVIRGDLVVDDSYFDDVRFLPGWKPIHAGRWFAAEISPLNLNDNCVDVLVVPGEPGGLARVEVTPASPFITVKGAPRTVARGKTRVLIRRGTDSNRLVISGQIRQDRKEWRDHVAVYDPALFFGHTLAATCRARGITIKGRVRRKVRVPGAARPPPKGPEFLLVSHKSTLELDLPVINKRSQNLHAEVLLKVLGARFGGEGSVAGGARSLRKFLVGKGIPTDGLVFADGSGLSHDSRLTTEALARALYAARSTAYFERFVDSLAVAGVDGTLRKRFREESQLRGRVFAKTGYITSTSAISGYLRRGSTYRTFSMFFQRLPGGNVAIKRLQERIVAAIDRRLELPGGP